MDEKFAMCFGGVQPQTPFLGPLSFENYEVTRSGLGHTILHLPAGGSGDTIRNNFHKSSFLKDISLDEYNLSIKAHNRSNLQCVFTSKKTKSSLWKLLKKVQYVAAMGLYYLGGYFTTYISNLVKVLHYEVLTGKEAKVLFQSINTGVYHPARAYNHTELEALKESAKDVRWPHNGPQTREFIRCRVISGQLVALGQAINSGKVKDYVKLDWNEDFFTKKIDDYMQSDFGQAMLRSGG